MLVRPVIEPSEVWDVEIEIQQESFNSKIKTLEDFKKFVSMILTECEFDGFILVKIPINGGTIEDNGLFYSSNQMYNSISAFADFSTWSILKPISSSYKPFRFKINSEAKGGTSTGQATRVAATVDALERIFLTHVRASSGCCIPFLMSNGTRALALFTGGDQVVDLDIRSLYLRVKKISEYIENSELNTMRPKLEILNTREIECLRWVAAGKTSSEIAKIMSLSEHTINHYLQVCCKKLDTVNRVQAAVAAVRLELI